MILKLTASGAKKVSEKFGWEKIDDRQVQCPTISEENVEIFIELAKFLLGDKPMKYSFLNLTDQDLVGIYSYNPELSEQDAYFAGLMEIPKVLKLCEVIGDGSDKYDVELQEVQESVKFKCDNKTTDMIYYTRTVNNEYLNISKNILKVLPQQQLKNRMFGDLREIFSRFEKCKTQINGLCLLPIADPIKYLYLVAGYGRQLADLLDSDYSIPDISEYYGRTEQVAFSFNDAVHVYIPGYGLLSEGSLSALYTDCDKSEVF